MQVSVFVWECNFLTDQNLPVILSCQWAQHAIFQSKFNCYYYGYWAIAKKVPFSKMSESPYIYTLPAGVSQKKSE